MLLAGKICMSGAGRHIRPNPREGGLMHDMTETQRRLRGHDFLPPPDERREIPGERATERVPLAEKVIRIHYFCASADWWITEIWPEDGQWMAFGYAQFASM